MLLLNYFVGKNRFDWLTVLGLYNIYNLHFLIEKNVKKWKNDYKQIRRQELYQLSLITQKNDYYRHLHI